MKMRALAVLAVSVLAAQAQAREVLIPNGSFEDQFPFGGFTQSITSWSTSFTQDPGSTLAFPADQYSGLTTSFGQYITAPDGGFFALLDNLGAGTATLSSSVFALTDRGIGFRYIYLTNDPAGSASNDGFTVTVDFFGDAAGTVPLGSMVVTPGITPVFPGNVGTTPFDSAPTTFNGPVDGDSLHFAYINVESFFNSFARISFTVDNSGPARLTNNNGEGVSGILLDEVILTPEPGTLALFGLGLAGLGGLALRRRRAAAVPPRAS